MTCEHCGGERKLYHPCPECGRPTFKERQPSAENDALFDGVPDENLRAATGGCTELSCIYHRRINAELRRREAVISPEGTDDEQG